MAKKVIKRNGKTVGFDIEKLYSAAQRAWEEVHPKEPDLPAVVRERIATSEKWFQELDHDPTVEEMQDQVVDTFHRCGFHDAGTAFTRYRERRAIARDNEVDANDLINSYLIRKDDLAVKENANMQFSLQGLNNFISESIIQKRWLSYYSDEVRKAHNTGRIHIHDLGSFGPYCMGWSLHDLLIEGFKGVPEKIQSAPAKHFGVALGQAVNFLYTMQGESAGAQAFSNFNTLLAPFVANDKLTYKQVKQKVQEFVYNMNVATRSGFQSCFSNLTFDLDVSKTRFADQFAIIGGVPTDKTYKEFQKEAEIIIDAFLEVYDEGDASGAMFSFPIPTFNVGKDFPWKSAFGKRLLALTAKYGTPYFANYINTEQTADSITSMCCRLRLDHKVIEKVAAGMGGLSAEDYATKHNRGGGFFGAGPLTGSTGVVTINMAAQAVDARTNRPFCDIDGYISHVLKTMDMCTKTLLKKRRVLEEMCDDGLYPYMRFYLRDVKARTGRWFAQHFNTICPNAIHEALIVLGIQGGITSPEGLEAADRILGAMAKKIVELQEKHKTLFNLEQAPAESAGVKMCQKSGIDPLGNAYYTNSSWIPADFACDFEFQLRHQARLNRHYSGGSVVHFYTDANLGPIADDLSKLIEYAFKETTLPYMTISPVFSTCKKCGYLPGKIDTCPKCGGTDVISYLRIIGYLQALKNFNAGRKKEANKRKYVQMSSEGASK
jgi:ribonucleoside-triphosphate reductase